MEVASSTIAAGASRPGTGSGGLVPGKVSGAVRRALYWLRQNLFSSIPNTVLTLAVVAFLAWALPPFLEWSLTGATIAGSAKSACTGDGACWTFIRIRLPQFFYGHYPSGQTWRVDVAGLLLLAFSIPVLRDNVRRRGSWLLLLLIVFPVLAGVLLLGGLPGLPYVDTTEWGGLMLDVLIAFVVVAGSIPFGVLLALGRRSQLSIVRALSVGFIELWRASPLLTVITMSAVMLPLFLPEGVHIDRLIRALVVLVLFNAAYMAETVRGGLQGVELGQEEAAYSVGLKWWQVQAFIVLPQALRHVMPGIVNNVVDLFKDTTLVTIIGLFDILGAVNQAIKDPAWLGLAHEGYVFTMVVFFACCFAMSSYARRMERRLNRHRTGRH
jgi:general L-amino acid transport system permease protein